MKKQIQRSLWLMTLTILVVGIIGWDYEPIHSADSEDVQEYDGQSAALQPSEHQTACELAGWTWREYGGRSWCETSLACSRQIPACPGGNDSWDSILNSANICDSTSATGYRVYCHAE